MDGLIISKPIADGKPSVAASTVGMAAFPRRRSRSASITNQNRRDQLQTTGKVDSTRDATLLSTQRIEASGSALRTGAHDPNTPGYLLIPSSTAAKHQEPFTVRAAAVAEAAATMATAAAPITKRQSGVSTQRPQNQLQSRTSQTAALGEGSTGAGAAKAAGLPPNLFMDNSSLTAPLMTIVSTKPPGPQNRTPSVNRIQLQFQDIPEPAHRPQTPYSGGLTGSSITSPRVGHALTAQAAAAFISTQQVPYKPPSSRQSMRSERALSPTSDHLSPRRLQMRHDESTLLATGSIGGSMIGATVPLAISGRTAAQSSSDMPSPRPFRPEGLLDNMLAAPDAPKDELKALLSPRYVIANPVIARPSARPQGSARALKSSPRPRHQSGLVTGPASSHLRRQELLGLAISTKP